MPCIGQCLTARDLYQCMSDPIVSCRNSAAGADSATDAGLGIASARNLRSGRQGARFESKPKISAHLRRVALMAVTQDRYGDRAALVRS